MTSSCASETLDDDEFAVTTTKPRPGTLVVRALGAIDLLSAPTWRTALHDAITENRDGPGKVVADLTSVTFLGASGLDVLLDVAGRAHDTGIDLRVVVGTRRVARVLNVMGVDRQLVLEATVTRAVRPGPTDFPPARRQC